MKYNQTHNKALQLTSNTPLRSVLRSTELKRYALIEIISDQKLLNDRS